MLVDAPLYALLAWYGPMLGIDIDHVDEDKNAEPAWMGYPGMALFALTMYECQRCVAAREKIEEQATQESWPRAKLQVTILTIIFVVVIVVVHVVIVVVVELLRWWRTAEVSILLQLLPRDDPPCVL